MASILGFRRLLNPKGRSVPVLPFRMEFSPQAVHQLYGDHGHTGIKIW